MGVVLSWNVAGRVVLQEEQIDTVLGHGADVVCLQEITPRTAPRWRLDHVLVSPQLESLGCEYLHEWRERGLSDHSAIWADVRPALRSLDAGAA